MEGRKGGNENCISKQGRFQQTQKPNLPQTADSFKESERIQRPFIEQKPGQSDGQFF